jgi:hypothetical protein
MAVSAPFRDAVNAAKRIKQILEKLPEKDQNEVWSLIRQLIRGAQRIGTDAAAPAPKLEP